MKIKRKLLIAAALATAAPTGLMSQGAWAQGDLEEIVVTGSHIKRQSQFDSASPIATIDQAEIDTTGFTTTSELVRWMPYNTGSENQTNALTQGGTPGTANINLRGLGLGSTLVLVNGRRQTMSVGVSNGGSTFVDINQLMPMIMIQRLETLKDGASAVYGADAVAGVANFITRSSFEGMEVRFDRAQTSRSDDQSDTTISGIWGASNGQSSVVLSASYMHRDGMYLTERDFPRNGWSSYGNPGTFFVTTLTGDPAPDHLLTTYTPDEGCEDFSVSSKLFGPVCKYDFAPNYSHVPDGTNLQTYGVASHQVNDDLGFYAEFGFSKSTFAGGYSSSFPLSSVISIPLDHPSITAAIAAEDPVSIKWLGRVLGDSGGEPGSGRVINRSDGETFRTVLGAEGSIKWSETWTWDLSHTYAQNAVFSNATDQIGTHLAQALSGLAGPDCAIGSTPGDNDAGCYYYNPFSSALTASPGDVDYNDPIMLDYLTTRNIGHDKTSMWAIDATATGDVLELPAGMVQAAFGYQHMKESRRNINSADSVNEDLMFLIGGPDQQGEREIDAFFAEAAVPIMDDDSMGTLDLELAVRYTDYDGAWNSTDPKIGLLWRPMDGLSLRGTFSTSFRAPTLYQVAYTGTALTYTGDGISGAAGFVPGTAIGNPDLKPEEADTISIGVSWSPEQIEGLTVGIDYYKVTYENMIATETNPELAAAQAVLWLGAGCDAFTSAERMADAVCHAVGIDPKVTRDYDPTDGSGTMTPTRFYKDRFNAASTETDGVDLNIRYAPDWQFVPGDVSFRNETTFVNSFKLQAVAGGPIIEGAGFRNNSRALARSIPEIRSNTTMSWVRDNHSANVIVRYISDYEDETDGAEIEKWVTLDVQYTYDMSEMIGLGGTLLTLGSTNVTDEDPPFTLTPGNDLGFDPKVHDSRGRMLYVRVVQQF